jgi:hypothetical protein
MAGRTIFRWVFLCAALCGCAVQGTNETVVGRYFGFVEVRSDPPPGDTASGVRHVRVRTLGGWLELSPDAGGVESVGAGWRSSDRLVVPNDCRLVIIVRNDAELASARALLDTQAIARGELCLIQDRELSSRP